MMKSKGIPFKVVLLVKCLDFFDSSCAVRCYHLTESKLNAYYPCSLLY